MTADLQDGTSTTAGVGDTPPQAVPQGGQHERPEPSQMAPEAVATGAGAGGLSFEPDGHVYRYAGQVIPSVTQVIGHAGLVDYSLVPDWMLHFKAEIGTAAHLAAELDDLGDLDEGSVDERVLPYVEAYRRFREESDVRIVALEQRLYHPRYAYAGTLDRIALYRGALSVLEIKTTAQHHERAVAIQTVAYMKAYNYGRPVSGQARRRYALHLRPDATYRLYRFTDHAADFAEFLTHLKEMNCDAA